MKKITILFVLNLLFAIAHSQEIKNITPGKASQVESVIISISSKNTTFKSGNYAAKLVNPNFSTDILKSTSATAVNDTLLDVAFTFNSSMKTGVYDIIVYSLQTSFSIKQEKAFTLTLPTNPDPPVLLSVSPSVATQGDTVEIIVKTKNTHFNQPVQIDLSLGDAAGSWAAEISKTVIDDETIKAKFLFTYYYAKEGIYDIRIYNSIDGSMTLPQSFTVKAGPFPPKIVSVSPDSANKMSSALITIKGKNTFFKRDSCKIRIGKWAIPLYPTSPINYLSDTVMTAKFDFIYGNVLTAGTYDVMVTGTKDYYELTLPNSFKIKDTLAPPVFLSFNPNNATQGDSVKITVKGRNTHFSLGYAGLSLINSSGLSFSGKAKVLNDSIVEETVFLDYIHDPGKYAVAISCNIDGLLFAVDSFTIYKANTPPKIISINPNNVVQGKKVDVLISASRNSFSNQFFLNPQLSNTKATYVAKSFSLVNDSTLLASFEFPIDTARIGIFDLNTTYPGYPGNLFLPACFTINKTQDPPKLIAINPSIASQFDTVIVNIKASNSHFLTNSPGVMMVASDNSNDYILSSGNTVLNDTTIQAKFILNANYYSSTLYDFRVVNYFDGAIELKKAFTINKIYTQLPSIMDINPKEGIRGQTITINIKGSPKSYRIGNNVVKLVSFNNPENFINAASVNYIDDSLITATFSFSSNDVPGNYNLQVINQAILSYYKNGGFTLKTSPSDSKLLALTPAWASQTDSISCLLTGFNTHFNLTDVIWLENKLGYQIKPFSTNVINDTVINVNFAFTKSNLPLTYSVNWKDAGNNQLKLEDEFTLTGSIDAFHLLDVSPREIVCYFSSAKDLTIRGTKTNFLSEVDTVFIFNNNPNGIEGKKPIYPLVMNILNDTTISAKFMANNNCGEFDIYVMGKSNYILTGKLRAFPPVTINEELKETPLTIFPNPSEGVFTLNVNKDFEQANLSVIDMYGKIIMNLDKIEATTSIDLSAYAAGIYFVKLVKDSTSKAEKIIKQ